MNTYKCPVCLSKFTTPNEEQYYCNECLDVEQQNPIIFKWVVKIIKNQLNQHEDTKTHHCCECSRNYYY